jgi:teichuronic acid biosynthesis glycosyltransferase TuaG
MLSQVDDLVSIITPAFRAAGVIEDTIRSVIAQTHEKWEMLIADDCSPDNTREVVERWVQMDPRIRLIRLNENAGPAAARNAALEVATGRWIAFLDSDDLWNPQKLEKSISCARRDGAAIVYTGFNRISADGTRIGRQIAVPLGLTYTQLLGNTAIATSTVLIDRLKVGDFRMRKTFYDDFDCWLNILKSGHRAVGMPESLMHYRVMDGSVSRNKKKSAMHVWQAYRRLEKLSLALSLWYFAHYLANGILKYRKF